MKTSLDETFYCDYNHPSIQQLAGRLSENTTDTCEIVNRTFYYVRDTVATGFDIYNTKASEVLKKGYGVCWGKSILLIALLRKNNIEASFGTIPVHRQFIKPLIGKFHYLINSPYNHSIVNVFLNDRWTILDPVLDKKTYDIFFAPKDVSWGIDWNGKDDCRIYIENVVGEPVIHENIDRTIITKAGNSELPEFIALKTYNYLNRRIWKKTGFIHGKNLYSKISSAF